MASGPLPRDSLALIREERRDLSRGFLGSANCRLLFFLLLMAKGLLASFRKNYNFW